jgi:hypothetical protein
LVTLAEAEAEAEAEALPPVIVDVGTVGTKSIQTVEPETGRGYSDITNVDGDSYI